MSSDRNKRQARSKILEVLQTFGAEGCPNRTLVGRLESMGYKRREITSAINSLEDSKRIEKMEAGSDAQLWRLAALPAGVS